MFVYSSFFKKRSEEKNPILTILVPSQQLKVIVVPPQEIKTSVQLFWYFTSLCKKQKAILQRGTILPDPNLTTNRGHKIISIGKITLFIHV